MNKFFCPTCNADLIITISLANDEPATPEAKAISNARLIEAALEASGLSPDQDISEPQAQESIQSFIHHYYESK